MKRYIRLYSNVLSRDICEEMMELFDRREEQHDVRDNHLMDFTQINMIQYPDTWKRYTDILSNTYLKLIDQYKHDTLIQTPIQWPEKYGFEEFRIKRYEPNKGRFDLHTDVNDLNSAKRFLVFFIYLNTNKDGGTEFPTLGLTSPCQQGNALMFPPLWTYPHMGQMPHHGRKYIVGSYLHYLRSEDDNYT